MSKRDRDRRKKRKGGAGGGGGGGGEGGEGGGGGGGLMMRMRGGLQSVAGSGPPKKPSRASEIFWWSITGVMLVFLALFLARRWGWIG